MSDLLPCPFCGGEAHTIEPARYGKSWGVRCECGAFLGFYFTEAEAVEAWNTRADSTCRNISKEWEKTSFAHAATSFCCSECGAHYVDCESYYAGLANQKEEQIRTNYCPNCGARVV